MLVMGELSRIENSANRDLAKATTAASHARLDAWSAQSELQDLDFSAKSQIHMFRSKIDARDKVMSVLIDSLSNENPGHPLADPEVVAILIGRIEHQSAVAPDVIKQTYPTGELPADAVRIKPDGSLSSIQGQPAFADPSPEQQSVNIAEFAMQKECGLSDRDLLDPGLIDQALTKMSDVVEQLKTIITEDDQKGFFGKLNKKARAAHEEQLRTATGHLAELEKALPIAQRYVANTEAANEKLGRLSAVLNSHGLEM